MARSHGEERAGHPVANARRVAQPATGEAEEQYVNRAKQIGGRAGGEARATALTPEKRQVIAKYATASRHRPT